MMGAVRSLLARAMAAEKGVTALEYALIGAVVVVALAAASGQIGGHVAAAIGDVSALMAAAGP